MAFFLERKQAANFCVVVSNRTRLNRDLRLRIHSWLSNNESVDINNVLHKYARYILLKDHIGKSTSDKFRNEFCIICLENENDRLIRLAYRSVDAASLR